MGRKSNLYMSEPKAWMNMLRISNSPTIVSNIMVGVALAIIAHREQWSAHLNSPPLQLSKPLLFIIVVLLLLYFAGMVLNDAFDAKRDQKIRPERPIPQGVITAKQAWITGFVMIAIATLLAFKIGVATGISTLALAFYILLYTFLHHCPVAAIPLMAICRGLVYVVAVSAFSVHNQGPIILIYCGIIAIYTAVLTFVGTFEHEKQTRYSWIIWVTLLPAVLPIVLYGLDSPIAWFAFIAFFIWILFAWLNFLAPDNKPISGMHKLISGFALLDCILIAAIGEYFIMIISAICFVFTVAAHRKILGT
jgi:4-hydroxybenzoate polyprenyltransferase